MKKKLFYLFILFSSAIFSKQIEICSTCAVKSIERGIALASNGDIIFVKKGIYKENNLLVEKSISIIGENGTVIDGLNKGSIFVFQTNDFVD